jgi:hypothetical protein
MTLVFYTDEYARLGRAWKYIHARGGAGSKS